MFCVNRKRKKKNLKIIKKIVQNVPEVLKEKYTLQKPSAQPGVSCLCSFRNLTH